MNKKLILLFSIYLIVTSAISLVVISDISGNDKATEERTEITNAIFLSNSKVPQTTFIERSGIIKAIILK
jgi:hypothetical protein